MLKITFSILYDNYSFQDGLQADWGFSCLIQGLNQTILFDTGANQEILLANMKKLGLDPGLVDIIFLSHEHYDHIGGLKGFLDVNPEVSIFITDFFPDNIKKTISDSGSRTVFSNQSQPITSGVFTTGVINGWIKEQSLVLETAKGLVLITGCAHPRITKIIAFTKEYFQQNIHLVFGGFHLGGFEKKEIREIIHLFRKSGVEKVGPTHCSGIEALTLFKEEYGENFLELGTGKVWSLP